MTNSLDDRLTTLGHPSIFNLGTKPKCAQLPCGTAISTINFAKVFTAQQILVDGSASPLGSVHIATPGQLEPCGSSIYWVITLTRTTTQLFINHSILCTVEVEGLSGKSRDLMVVGHKAPRPTDMNGRVHVVIITSLRHTRYIYRSSSFRSPFFLIPPSSYMSLLIHNIRLA